MDRYAAKRRRVARIISEWNTGTITLTRTTTGAPDPSTPWTPGAPTTAVFTLAARVDGVTADYVDGTTVLATDLLVIASPKARDAGGDVVDIVPTMADEIAIDGAAKVVKKIEAVPAAGPAARFHIFIAS